MKMQVDIVGQGSPPLVLVGGGVTGWLSWEPHAKRLANRRQVVRPQLLNVELGLEGKPLPRGYSVKMESAALAGALEAVGLGEPYDLVAWSYGALVSLDMALDHATQVRSLTLIEPPALWVLRARRPLDATEREFADTMGQYRGEISEAQLERFLVEVGLCPPGKVPRELPQWPVWNRHRQSIRNSPAVLEHLDSLERLRNFRRPALLVKGEGSSPVLHRIIDELSDELPDVQLLTLPGGHAPQLAAADAFLERMGEFQSRAWLA